MTNVAVIGAQWGDEGKGKVVDWLAERADVVVRFQGGHNAGHTLQVANETYKLSLLPSGVVRGTLSIIGNGVVVDPWALLEEMDRLRGQGIAVSPETLRLAESATLILPFYGRVDQLREKRRGKGAIGTTGRGIGVAYEDKAGRRAIRVADLYDDAGSGRRSATCWSITTHCSGDGARRKSRRTSSLRVWRRFAVRWRLMSIAFGSGWTGCVGPGSDSCSKARKAFCSMWTTAPILS